MARGFYKQAALLLAVFLLAVFSACGEQSAPAGSGVPAPGSQPAPQPAFSYENDENPAFLTGLPKDAGYPEGKRITAVMVNNITDSRPAYGLSEAKILIEIKVEWPITRFMALYEDYEALPAVGSVRSARDQFLQLLIPYWGFYIHDGPDENQPVNWMLRDYIYAELDLQLRQHDGLYWEDPSRDGQTFFWRGIDGARVADTIAETGADDYRSYAAPMFYFVSYNEPPRKARDGKIEAITVPHTESYQTFFDYDAASGQYAMSMFNGSSGLIEPTVDAGSNARLVFDNLLVLFAPMSIYEQSDLVKVDYSQGGVGYLFTQGCWELVRWHKGAPNQRLWLEYLDYSDENDRYVYLNPGKTYIAIVDDDALPGYDAAVRADDMDAIPKARVTDPVDFDD